MSFNEWYCARYFIRTNVFNENFLSKPEFWSSVSILGCSLPLKVAIPKQNSCSQAAKSLCCGEKAQTSISSDQPCVSRKYLGDWKFLVEWRISDFWSRLLHPVQIISGYSLTEHSDSPVHLRLVDVWGKTGKDNGNPHKHFLQSLCFYGAIWS